MLNTEILTKLLAAQAISLTQQEYYGVSINSRTIKGGEIFIALKGEKYDGHNFAAEAIKQGAKAVITETPISLPCLLVSNTMESLQKIAVYARNNMAKLHHNKSKIFAITGSVGKTTLKEMLGRSLSTLGNTVFAKNSFNNHIGVPLSLAQLQTDTLYGVFEIGTNHQGEIAPLSRMVKPDVAIITTIAPAHIGLIGSLENIALEKSEIINGLDKDGTVILNRDNQFFEFLAKKAGDFNIISVGEHLKSDIKLLDYYEDNDQKGVVTVDVIGKIYKYTMQMVGKHFAFNSILALAAALAAKIPIEPIINHISKMHPLSGRGKIHLINLPSGISFQLIDDSYNANPASVKAGLQNLAKNSGKQKIAVLGDMGELGDYSKSLHQEIGQFIAELGNINYVFTYGVDSIYVKDNLPKNCVTQHYNDMQHLKAALLEVIKNGDIVMVKGKNSLHMQFIVDDFLKNNF